RGGHALLDLRGQPDPAVAGRVEEGPDACDQGKPGARPPAMRTHRPPCGRSLSLSPATRGRCPKGREGALPAPALRAILVTLPRHAGETPKEPSRALFTRQRPGHPGRCRFRRAMPVRRPGRPSAVASPRRSSDRDAANRTARLAPSPLPAAVAV